MDLLGGEMTQSKNQEITLAVKAFKIGNKVRELRQKNRFTLQDLATKTGLSKPFLSQIENDHVVPPIATLLKLARALNVGMAFFFQDEIGSDKISITRHEERIRVERRPHQEKGEVDYIYVALETKKTNKSMEPFLVEFPIRETTDMVFMSHEGEEFLYVTEGAVEFRTVDRVEQLEPGDSIYFESDISHSFRCISKDPAKALAVIWNKT
jgi:transcriptional regulator with XRE-family HTH domain